MDYMISTALDDQFHCNFVPSPSHIYQRTHLDSHYTSTQQLTQGTSSTCPAQKAGSPTRTEHFHVYVLDLFIIITLITHVSSLSQAVRMCAYVSCNDVVAKKKIHLKKINTLLSRTRTSTRGRTRANRELYAF